VSNAIIKEFYCCSGRVHIDMLIHNLKLYTEFLRSFYCVSSTELCTTITYNTGICTLSLDRHRDRFDCWAESKQLRAEVLRDY